MASIAKNYARAMADVVFKSHLDSSQVLREVQAITDLVSSSKPLREVWEAPSIPAVQKLAVLDAIVAREGFSKPVRNFVAVIIDHRRVPFLGAMGKELELELDRRLGFTDAEVVSARDLNQTEKQQLVDRIQGMTGRKVRARYHQDPSVLGGAVVKIGSTIYDGSVRGQLERIREKIVGVSS